ncbi:hypothetical protein AMELA_G00031480 [Ameiurus melas]|uniref:Uncharacterized protein n=1 Tax=Ameiurus melas TaxID=219545 RepID=A0A7J6BA96_AMEME|nr:hypothetical protein AMELA_G00031480 [Ameiurus melas]
MFYVSSLSGLTPLINVKMFDMTNQIKEDGLYCLQRPECEDRRPQMKAGCDGTGPSWLPNSGVPLMRLSYWTKWTCQEIADLDEAGTLV